MSQYAITRLSSAARRLLNAKLSMTDGHSDGRPAAAEHRRRMWPTRWRGAATHKCREAARALKIIKWNMSDAGHHTSPRNVRRGTDAASARDVARWRQHVFAGAHFKAGAVIEHWRRWRHRREHHLKRASGDIVKANSIVAGRLIRMIELSKPSSNQTSREISIVIASASHGGDRLTSHRAR